MSGSFSPFWPESEINSEFRSLVDLLAVDPDDEESISYVRQHVELSFLVLSKVFPHLLDPAFPDTYPTEVEKIQKMLVEARASLRRCFGEWRARKRSGERRRSSRVVVRLLDHCGSPLTLTCCCT